MKKLFKIHCVYGQLIVEQIYALQCSICTLEDLKHLQLYTMNNDI
jgi:hypothetical protein